MVLTFKTRNNFSNKISLKKQIINEGSATVYGYNIEFSVARFAVSILIRKGLFFSFADLIF